MAIHQGTNTLLLSADAVERSPDGATPRQGLIRGYGPYSNGLPAFTITFDPSRDNWVIGAASDTSGRVYALVALFSQPDIIAIYDSPLLNPVRPDRVIAGPHTGLANFVSFGSIAVDAAGKIYVNDAPDRKILIYAAGASGDVAPVHAIVTDGSVGNTIRLDSSGNMYLSGENSIEVLPAGHYGIVAPIRKISGANTKLLNSVAIALGRDGTIYATNGGSAGYITAYAPGANGNVAPIRTIAGGFTHLFPNLYSIAVCADGTIYAEALGTIDVFKPFSNGNVAPVKILSRPGGIPAWSLGF